MAACSRLEASDPVATPGMGPTSPAMSGSAGTRREVLLKPGDWRPAVLAVGRRFVRLERFRLACSRGTTCRLSASLSGCLICTIKPDDSSPTNDLIRGVHQASALLA